MATESKVIGIEELCALLDIGKNTAYDLLNNGEIDAFKIGSQWKIVRADVDGYISRMIKSQKKVMVKIIDQPTSKSSYRK